MRVLVLGIGNTLLSDEGAGVVAMQSIQRHMEKEGTATDVTFLDGGTLSFTLAVPIEECDALVVLDAAMIDGPVGCVACFEGEAMDRFLGENRKSSVHEVGLIDLMTIARLTERWPSRRALIGVRPEKLDWGEVLTPAVAEGVATMCVMTSQLIARWCSAELNIR